MNDPFWIIAVVMLGAGVIALWGKIEIALAIDAAALIVLVATLP